MSVKRAHHVTRRALATVRRRLGRLSSRGPRRTAGRLSDPTAMVVPAEQGVIDRPVHTVEPVPFSDDLPDISWTGQDGERPSYVYKLHESKRRKVLLNHEGHRQRVWAFNDKAAGLRLAAEVGVAVPETLVTAVHLADIDWTSLPDRFVLKPLNGAANRGTFLLCREGDRYLDLMDGRRKTREDITRLAGDLIDRRLVSARFCVEELLAPRADLVDRVAQPDDFKVYCFWDRPAVVMQRRLGGHADSSRWRFKFWSNRWVDLGPVKYPDRCDPDLERPEGADEILDVAARIGHRLAIPFVRLDVYDTDRGVVFGEVSPHPGPPEHWAPWIDELLGREWEFAEARLLAAGVAPNEPLP